MNVHLSPEQEQFVNRLLEQGEYLTPCEVVRDALSLLQEREEYQERKFAELKAEVQKGIDQLDRGEYKEYDEESLRAMFEEIKNRGAARQQRKASA